MRKLHLNVEELEIQSFETTSAPHRARGTVEAHETLESECVCDTVGCGGGGTTGYTCGGCDTPGFTCEDNCTGGPSVAEPIRNFAAF
jgi:hypothetical protein